MATNYEMNKTTKRGWTKQPNAILNDKDLTSDAKVIIYALLSISGDYHISESGIASTVNISLDRVKKAIKLLKSTGYIEVTRVMNNHRLNGYMWKISDANGTYRKCDFREMENPATENPTDEISSDRETQRPKTRLTENLPTYKYTERYQETNNQEMNYQGQNENQLPHHQPDAVEEDVSPTPCSGNYSGESGSEAKASPLPNKSQGDGGAVMPEREFEFQQFLKKYPKKPTGTDMESTRKAFFEATVVDGSFAEIMAGLADWCNSVDWNKENGRYITKPLNFLTTRKWEEVPRTINTEIDPGLWRFIRPRDVEDYI